ALRALQDLCPVRRHRAPPGVARVTPRAAAHRRRMVTSSPYVAARPECRRRRAEPTTECLAEGRPVGQAHAGRPPPPAHRPLDDPPPAARPSPLVPAPAKPPPAIISAHARTRVSPSRPSRTGARA